MCLAKRTKVAYLSLRRLTVLCENFSTTGDTLEISENQIRQITAVTAFQNTEERNARFAQRFTEPMKIFRLQSFLRERIARVAIESRRDADEFGFEFL